MFEKLIFTKDARWKWAFNVEHTALCMKPKDLDQEWFEAEVFCPDNPDYDTSIHDKQVERLLSNPEGLVRYKDMDRLKELVVKPV